MEQHFDSNKEGDYKYIFEQEQRKQNGKTALPDMLQKQTLIIHFRNWIVLRLLSRPKTTCQLKLFSPVLFEFFR